MVYGGPFAGPAVKVALHVLRPSTWIVVLGLVPVHAPLQDVNV
jgi:hypothetical protein